MNSVYINNIWYNIFWKIGTMKQNIIGDLCYTPLVYDRINNKLSLHLSNKAI